MQSSFALRSSGVAPLWVQESRMYFGIVMVYMRSYTSHNFRSLYPKSGAVFADLQLFPGAGAWHSSELPEIFGTFIPATATAAEVTLSHTMNTLVANFIKNPTVSPAPNWPKYVPGSLTTTLAKLAYNGNVEANNVVQAVESDSIDNPCNVLWNLFLDVRE
ncbi:hypothetical protein K438DRAFT_2163145 [Mycena galopus ATCC 62051]|nr:hypothetical protein K438DRAFT_2163145 [Mycena galopus ATCC 62051]